jgi:hypothetical protein
MARHKSLKNSTSKTKPVPVKIVSDTPANSYNSKEEQKWRAQDDIRTLQRAEEIKRDKDRMSAVKNCAKEQMQDLKKIC